MRISVALMTVVGILCLGLIANAQMSSTNYEIRWDTFSSGGDDSSGSASYQLRDTISNAAIGESESATYQASAGYRAAIFDEVLSFDVLAQVNGSAQAVTGLAGTTVTTATAGLSVGDFVAVVQDAGAGQVTGVGRIASIGAGNIVLDELKDGGVAPVIDGTNDFLYVLGSTTANLGGLSKTATNIVIVGLDVSADLDNGYVVQLIEDGNLRSGANDINDVADGAVSTGSEEYGARSSDTSLAGSTFDTEDAAITSNFQDIADESSAAYASRNFVELKASINNSTPNATYAQSLSFIISSAF